MGEYDDWYKDEVREHHCPKCNKSTKHVFSGITETYVKWKCSECKDDELSESSKSTIKPIYLVIGMGLLFGVIRNLGFTYEESSVIGAGVAVTIWVVCIVIDKFRAKREY